MPSWNWNCGAGGTLQMRRCSACGDLLPKNSVSRPCEPWNAALTPTCSNAQLVSACTCGSGGCRRVTVQDSGSCQRHCAALRANGAKAAVLVLTGTAHSWRGAVRLMS